MLVTGMVLRNWLRPLSDLPDQGIVMSLIEEIERLKINRILTNYR